MYRSTSKRLGVYVSPETIAKMKEEGTYDALLRIGVVAENFDGQGGTLITKSRKAMDEAVAAREGGQTDMQAIIGGLTGAGVAKPNVPKPAVVQRKDEAGNVVQQSAVAPEQAAATAEAMAGQPGEVEVTTPEKAMGERDARVQAEQLLASIDKGGIPLNPAVLRQAVESFGLETKGTDTPESLVERLRAAVTRAAPPAQEPVKKQAKTPLQQLDDALTFAVRAVAKKSTPGGKKMDVKNAAMAVGALAQAIRVGVAEAQARGATAEDVAPAMKAAKAAERLTEKSDDDFLKSRGVSEAIVRGRLAELSDAIDSLRQWADKPLNPVAEPGSKGRVAKKKSKDKEPARNRPRNRRPRPARTGAPPRAQHCALASRLCLRRSGTRPS